MKHKKKSLLILAGGLGTRLRDAIPDLPKPMAPIGNSPFLKILIDYWITQEIKEIILLVGYKYEKIQEFFGKSYKNIPIKYSIELSPLGTGGAFRKAMESYNVSENFIFLNGDTFFKLDCNSFFLFHENNKSNFTMAVFKSITNSRYMPLSLNLKTNKLEEYNDRRKKIFLNGGIYIINKNIFNSSNFEEEKFSLEDTFIRDNIKSNNIYGFYSNGNFIDIGVPDDYYFFKKNYLNIIK